MCPPHWGWGKRNCPIPSSASHPALSPALNALNKLAAFAECMYYTLFISLLFFLWRIPQSRTRMQRTMPYHGALGTRTPRFSYGKANVSHHFCKHASPFGLLHLHMILLPSFQTNCIWDHANRASQGSNKSSLWCCCHAAQRLSAGSSSSALPDRGSEKHLHILAARLSTDSPALEHEQLLATKASQCMLYRNISSEELFLKVRVFS